MKLKIGITHSETNYANYPKWIQGTEGVEIIELSHAHNNLHEIALCDGVVLTGGIDSHPQFYLKEYDLDYPHAPKAFAVHRDTFELAVLEEALKNKKPILGICRGLQLINIYFGGTLHVDIGDSKNEKHKKRGIQDKEHAIWVDKNSVFFAITQCETGFVNSAHHQAIDVLADNLKAVAVSEDQIIEAVELVNANQPFLLAVQWHPERMLPQEHPFTKNIRKAFLEKCLLDSMMNGE